MVFLYDAESLTTAPTITQLGLIIHVVNPYCRRRSRSRKLQFHDTGSKICISSGGGSSDCSASLRLSSVGPRHIEVSHADHEFFQTASADFGWSFGHAVELRRFQGAAPIEA